MMPDAFNAAQYRQHEITPFDIKDEILAYVRPYVLEGMPVRWFVNAQRAGTGLLAFVQAVATNRETIDLYVPGGAYQRLSGVRHMSDPQLKISANRENGGWDYSQDWIAEQEWKKSVDDRLAAFEQFLNEKPTPAKKPKDA